MPASITRSELDRLAALEAYQTLDDEGSGAFDRYTRLAASVMGTKMAAISLVGEDRTWFRSVFGMESHEHRRQDALCAETILHRDPMVVCDTLLDPRFNTLAIVSAGPRIRFYAGAPLVNPGGLTVGALCALDTVPRIPDTEMVANLVDLASAVVTTFELFKSMREIKLLALSDALTGLPNRLHLYHALASAIAQAAECRTSMSLLYIDCDNFKQVNDTMGHSSGDALLNTLGKSLRACLRSEEMPARVGGDEFMVILPGAGPKAAWLTGERIRSHCNGALQAGGWPVTLSIGAITFLLPPATADAAIGLADEAMYFAKRAGKNQVQSVIAGEAAELTLLQPALGDATP